MTRPPTVVPAMTSIPFPSFDAFRVEDMIDLAAYPLHELESARGRDLVARCQADLAETGMFNLEGFVWPLALAEAVADLQLLVEEASFLHRRRHNAYFLKTVDGLAPGHSALREFDTAHRTVCADQFSGNPLCRLYEWPQLIAFIARVMEQPELHTMADPLARLNVMTYCAGQGLGWHFDRSPFTTTLLLQAPTEGGMFEYRTALRSEDDPNYDGVGRLLAGQDEQLRSMPVRAGTLNLFKGRNTIHRVTPVSGDRDRVIAVFSYYPRPDVLFTPEERIGFYGRAA
jgi:hypothetical protein